MRNILIDGGISKTYTRHLKKELNALVTRGESLDLLIITHIDDDHIGGIIKLYEDVNLDRGFIKHVWFNSGNLLSDFFKSERDIKREVSIIPSDQAEASVGQGMTLENLLLKEANWLQKIVFTGYGPVDFYGSTITILSPNEAGLKRLNSNWQTEKDKITEASADHDDFDILISELVQTKFKEDRAVPNGSSIAFMIEHEGKRALLLGDSHPSVIENSLRDLGFSSENRLNVDLVKVSHHSSKKNTSPGLLELIESKQFVISTDGTKHGLPDKQAMARIITSNPGCTLHFNYDGFYQQVFTESDHKEYQFKVNSLTQAGSTITL